MRSVVFFIAKKIRIAFIGQESAKLGAREQSDLYNIILGLVDDYDYIEFNSGYGNPFERTASDIAKNILLGRNDKVGAINLWLPYRTPEHIQNRKYYEAFFDWVVFCSERQRRSAHEKRDRELIKYSNLIIFCINEEHSEKRRIKIAQKQKKRYINIARNIFLL